MSLLMHGSPPISLPEAEPILQPRQRAWLEINREAITANARTLKRHLSQNCKLMAVVKADGYGHGAVAVAEAARAGGAESFGVATLAEAIELRQGGIAEPILVLGNLQQPEDFRCCLHWRVMPTISSLGQGLICSNVAAAGGRPLQLHLKLDTGMARLGVDWQEGPRLLEALNCLEGLEIEGIYSHLADADGPSEVLTRQQQQRFESVLARLQDLELRPGRRHLANSAATLAHRDLHYDMVRVGLALYGHAPAPQLQGYLPLQPVMSVRARVTLLREVAAGVGVSYGHQFHTTRPSRLAVLGIGYADGVSRRLSGRLQVLAQGRRLPQVGAITMDQLVIDATDAPDLEVGAVVTLLGRDGDDQISPESWAQASDTIAWEVLCGFKHRLPRLPSGAGH